MTEIDTLPFLGAVLTRTSMALRDAVVYSGAGRSCGYLSPSAVALAAVLCTAADNEASKATSSPSRFQASDRHFVNDLGAAAGCLPLGHQVDVSPTACGAGSLTPCGPGAATRASADYR